MDHPSKLTIGAKVAALPLPKKRYRGFYPNFWRLEPGTIYTISQVETNNNWTWLAVEEIPGVSFNACSFMLVAEE